MVATTSVYSVRLPRALWAKIKKKADEDQRTIGATLARLVEEALNGRRK